MKLGVAVAGTGWSAVARSSDRTVTDMLVEATTRALDDAGLTLADIDGIATSPTNASSRTDVSVTATDINAGDAIASVDGIDGASLDHVARAFGLRRLRWFNAQIKGMITGAFATAVNAVATGACECVLVYRGIKAARGTYGTYRSAVAPGVHQFKAPYGLEGWYVFYALTYSRYAALYGVTRERMAPFIAANRRHAAANPDAVFFGRPISEADYLADEVIADPCSRLDFDMPVDGAGALIVTTAERARQLRRPPAYVLGHAVTGFDLENAIVHTYDAFMEQAEWSAKVLWQNCGFGPEAVSCFAIHDCLSAFVPMWLEALGVCGRGEGVDVLGSGVAPVNRMGGSLGMGRLHGMPQLIEAVRQVQGLAGAAQVRGASVSLAYAGTPIDGGASIVFGSEIRKL